MRTKPFGYEFAGDKKSKKIFMVRLSEKDKVTLQEFKDLINIEEDSTAFKIALKMAKSVIQSQFSDINVRLALKRKGLFDGKKKKSV